MRCWLPLYFATAGFLVAEAPPTAWESGSRLTEAELAPALAKLETAGAKLPPELAPALTFQRLLLRIRAGAPAGEWREALGKYTATGEKGGVAAGLREIAQAYEARARMAEIDTALRGFYRHEVRFPATLGEIKATLPVSAQSDPWGDAWAYAPTAPKNFSAKFAAQRYTLAPSKHPGVRSLTETMTAFAPAKEWKVGMREVGGQRVLEIRTAAGQTVATQAGGRVEDATVLYVGDGWALCADLERLFTIAW